jgi:hypothetical protein
MSTFPHVRNAARLAAVIAAGGALAASAVAFTSWSVAATPSPATYGNLFKAVTAVGATDAWAVGGGATSTSNVTFAAHWNGSSWSAVGTPNPAGNCQDGNIQWAGNTLNAVAATSPGDVWAVGHTCYSAATLVQHWNGGAWSIVRSPSFTTGGDGIQNTLNGVVALSSSNVWAVGEHTASNGAFVTLVERWNGSSWSVVTSPSPSSTANDLYAVSATSANDVWAVGYQNGSSNQPLIEHWNGSAWSVVASPTLAQGAQLTGVKAISASDAWAVGWQKNSAGALLTLALHWNGSAWGIVSTPNLSTAYGSQNVLRCVTALSSSNVWAGGMWENGSTGSQHRTLTLHWNGSSWSVVSSPTPGKSGELLGITSDAASGRLFGAGIYSNNPIDIYTGTYQAPRTLVLAG